MASRTLPDRLKIVVLQRLAAFETPSQVAEFVRHEFGVEITRQSIEYYDPAKNARLPQKWREVFERERTRFFSEQQRHPIDVRAFRQRLRHQLIQTHGGDLRLVRLLLNDCAKDVGGLFDKPIRGRKTTSGERIFTDTVSTRNRLGNGAHDDFSPSGIRQMSNAELESLIRVFAARCQQSPEQLEQPERINPK
jgi:hypothetical protein